MPISLKDFKKGSEATGKKTLKGWGKKILDILDKGPHSRGEVARELGIRQQMVKQYTDDFEDKGKVVKKYCDIPGNPAHLFFTTPAFLEKEAKTAVKA